MITLRQMRHFLVLAEELNFSRAAQRLAITQPPLSMSIAMLERHLDVKLFERNKRRVELTQAGKGFLREVRLVLNQTERACEVARLMEAGHNGYIDIGITGSMTLRGVPRAVQTFMAENPDVHTTLSEQSTSEQIEALLSRRLDVGFVNFAAVPKGLDGVPLPDEAFVCCLPAGHPLTAKRRIALTELADESFVMFVRELSPYNYDNVINSCMEAGFYPNMRFAARQWLTVSALVGAGLGVALVPSSIASSGIKGAAFRPLVGLRARSRAWCLRHKDNHDPIVLAFFDALQRSIVR